jgi:hypothetical protein
VSIAEVERLWLRFQQMGCNKDGVLTAAVLGSPVLSGDVFMKNVSTKYRPFLLAITIIFFSSRERQL